MHLSINAALENVLSPDAGSQKRDTFSRLIVGLAVD
jgi:hypothetical protein